MLFRALNRYSELLMQRPYVTNLSSAVFVSVTGDAIAQVVEAKGRARESEGEKRPIQRRREGEGEEVGSGWWPFDLNFNSDFTLDRNRCLTMMAWGGVLTTPVWLTFYRTVDRLLPLKSLRHVLAKVGLAAAVMTPPMNAGYMVFCTYFEDYLNGSKKSALELQVAARLKLDQDWKRVVLSSWSAWIPINTLNWLLFPNHLRLVVTTIGNVFWNTYISFIQHLPLPAQNCAKAASIDDSSKSENKEKEYS